MIKFKLIGILLVFLLLTGCSVQQFAVNTAVQPFENGGRLWGEKTKKCGKDGWEIPTKSSFDLHVLGYAIKNSETQKMASSLNVTSYTIETKSNLWIRIITGGIVDYKIVKVIKREN